MGLQYTSSAMTPTVRKLALECLLKLDRGPHTIASVVDRQLRNTSLSNVDAALLTELVYGVLRWRGRLDWVLSQLVKRQPDNSVQNILRLGLYQLLLMDKVPEHAAIYETVALCRKHQKAFVNAVLRNAQRKQGAFEYPSDPVEYQAAFHSYPRWLIERWFQAYGPEWTKAFCEASNRQALLDVRLNTLKADRQQVIDALQSEGCEIAPLPHAPDGVRIQQGPPISKLATFRRGWCTVQDEAAMLVTDILDPQPGETIVDVCAAPGGKTTHIAQRMQNKGHIIAIDQAEPRLRRLRENCRRLGVENVHTHTVDAQESIPDLLMADRVLVDVPCSGFGTLRRHPDIRWKRSGTQIEELAAMQLAILAASAGYLRSGGVLVYSTCTTERAENQQVVQAFLDHHASFHPEPLESLPSLSLEQGIWQTFPHEHHMDGFFIARLRKD